MVPKLCLIVCIVPSDSVTNPPPPPIAVCNSASVACLLFFDVSVTIIESVRVRVARAKDVVAILKLAVPLL